MATVTDAAGDFQRSYFYARDAYNGKTVADVTVLQSRCYAVEQWAVGAGTWTTREETDWSYTATAPNGAANFVYATRVRQYQGVANRKTSYTYAPGSGGPNGNESQVGDTLYLYDNATVVGTTIGSARTATTAARAVA